MVNDAYLHNANLQFDVQYGMGSEQTLGILLVEGLETKPGGFGGFEIDFQIKDNKLINGGKEYPIAYAELDPKWGGAIPAGSVRASIGDANTTRPLPADILAKAKNGQLTAVLITGGFNRGPANYYPRAIHIP